MQLTELFRSDERPRTPALASMSRTARSYTACRFARLP